MKRLLARAGFLLLLTLATAAALAPASAAGSLVGELALAPPAATRPGVPPLLGLGLAGLAFMGRRRPEQVASRA